MTRPEFHFTAPSGWINDPLGFTARDGGYDTFFQYVPDADDWAPNCHWGHATGPDLFSLQAQPIAIAPGDGDDGIWTGCVVEDDDGDAVAFYTAVSVPEFGIGRIRSARPDDRDWTSWTKGPVVVEAPAGLDLMAFRDPYVRRDGNLWRMYVGAAFTDGRAAALTYSSPDLRSWRYDGIAASRSNKDREPVWTGSLWECPQLVDFDDRTALITSVWDADELYYSAAALGELSGPTFTPDTWQQLSFGPSLYAPSTFQDSDGKACVTFWLRGVSDTNAGWVGAHSAPYQLSTQNGRLTAKIHPDITQYYGKTIASGGLVDGAAFAMWDPAGGHGQLRLTRNDEVVASVVAKPGLVHVEVGGEITQLPAGEGELQILIDGPILEVCTGNAIGAWPLGAASASTTIDTTERLTLSTLTRAA